MSSITLDERINPDDINLDYLETHHYLPGEKVVESNGKGQPKALELRQQKGELTIVETRLAINDANEGRDPQSLDFHDLKLKVVYAFAEIEGLHDATDFCLKEGFVVHYGTVIKIDDQIWMVPLAVTGNDYNNPSSEQPLLIDTELMRGPKLHFCPEIETKKFFDNFKDSPLTGDVYLIPIGDNYQMSNAPWWAPATENEIALATIAVNDFKSRQVTEEELSTPELG